MHLLGYLLHKESGQPSSSSADEIAPTLFPGHTAEWSRHIGVGLASPHLLPLSHPALAIPIADVRFLRHSVLVLAQPSKQFPFLRHPLDFDQLSPDLRILLL